MATSAVPEAIAGLLAVVRAVDGLDGVEIVDGPPTVNLDIQDRIHIGWQPGRDVAATLTQRFASAGARTRDEDGDIVGYVESRTGDVDMAAARERAYEVLAVLENALRATASNPTAPTLGGAVQWAHLVAGDLYQSHTDGSVAGVEFTVRYRARI